MKTKILADFQICISVPLNVNCKFILIQLSEMRGAGRLKNSHLWLNEPLRDIGDVRFFLKNKPIPY